MEHCLPIRVINLQRDYDGKEHSTKLLFDKGHWWVYWVSSLWFQRENLQNVLATYLLLRSWARRFFYGYVRCSYCCLAADIFKSLREKKGQYPIPSLLEGGLLLCRLITWVSNRKLFSFCVKGDKPAHLFWKFSCIKIWYNF